MKPYYDGRAALHTSSAVAPNLLLPVAQAFACIESAATSAHVDLGARTTSEILAAVLLEMGCSIEVDDEGIDHEITFASIDAGRAPWCLTRRIGDCRRWALRVRSGEATDVDSATRRRQLASALAELALFQACDLMTRDAFAAARAWVRGIILGAESAPAIGDIPRRPERSRLEVENAYLRGCEFPTFEFDLAVARISRSAGLAEFALDRVDSLRRDSSLTSVEARRLDVEIKEKLREACAAFEARAGGMVPVLAANAWASVDVARVASWSADDVRAFANVRRSRGTELRHARSRSLSAAVAV